MANPAADLFNDAAIGAGLAFVGVSGQGALSEEDATGESLLVLSTVNGLGNSLANCDRLLIGPLVGDFDFAVSMLAGVAPIGGETPEVEVGLYETADISAFLRHGESGSGGYANFRAFAGGSGLFFASAGRRRAVGTYTDGYWIHRMQRTGSAVQSGWLSDIGGTWLMNAPPGFYITANPLYFYVTLRSNSAAVRKMFLRAIVPLVAGARAVPAAPTGGLAFSAPSTGDARLTCAAEWSAPASNVARKVEYQSALDSGFSTGFERRVEDLLMDGEPLSYRRCAAVAAGQPAYFRARLVDELGQPGTFSSTVNATAAVNPSIVPSFIHPAGKFRLPVRRFRA